MPCGLTWATKAKKSYPETAESGQFWRSTLLEMDTRLRVARGIAKDETQASVEVFQTLKRRGHPDSPPATISDGWGGIDDAMIAVYGLVPEYSGRGRPPTRKRAQPNWQYLQMVKQRDEHGKFQGVKLRVIYGKKSEVIALLGKSTAYIERSNLTSRLFNGRQTRKTLAFSKDLHAIEQLRPGKIFTIILVGLIRVYACASKMPYLKSGYNAHPPWRLI